MLMVLMADPLGNIPITISCMKNVPNKRRTFVLFRECMIAMGMLLLAMFFRQTLLGCHWTFRCGIEHRRIRDRHADGDSYGLPTQEGVFGQTPGGEPYIVPIAIPAIAGPSTLATIMMLAASEPNRLFEWGAVVVITCVVSFLCWLPPTGWSDILGEKLTLAF